MNSVLPAPNPWHSGQKLAAVLKKVQVSPALLDGVMHPAKLTTLWTVKLTATYKLQPDLQGRWLAAKVGAHDSPRAFLQLQRRLKKLVRCHPKPILPMQLFCVAFLFARYERKEPNAKYGNSFERRAKAGQREERNKWRGTHPAGQCCNFAGVV